MKKSIHSVLPALALLTLGGCAGTSALTTTESDGVYFSSKDRVTAPIASQSATDASGESDANNSGDVANPDYAGNSNPSSSGSTVYYDDGFSYASRLRRFHQPTYRGLGMGYYDFAYTDPFWYGGSAYSYYPGMYSRLGSPFYDPFYSPFWGGGSYISISIGRPWYRPFGYGYSPYDAYGYGYGYGGYGYGGFGGGYYNGYLNGNGYGNGVGSGNYDRNTRNRTVYAPRRDGATEASRATGTATSGGIRGQVQQNAVLAPSTGSNGVVSSAPEQPIRGRGRVDERQLASPAPASSSQGVVTESGTGRTGRVLATDQAQPNLNPGGGRRWRVLEEATTQPGTQSASQPGSAPADYSQPRRGRGWSNDGQPAQQEGRSFEQPARRERAWQQPSRSEEATQPSRSYEQPTRSYEPSRSSSSSSNGGSFGGGGNSGGGSRGRGRVE